MRILLIHSLSLLFAFHRCPLAAGDHTKTDVLYMKNGDRLTCEIKSMQHGQLSVKMDYTSADVIIDWSKVERLESRQFFVIETEHGAYHAGAINTNAKESNDINVTLAERTTPVPQREVVTVEQLSRSFWGRMKGEVDYGFSFARSNKQTQSTLHLNLNARTEKRYTTITADSLFSTTAGVKTNRHAASATFSNRLGATNWSLAGIGGILKSDQQQLVVCRRDNVSADAVRGIGILPLNGPGVG